MMNIGSKNKEKETKMPKENMSEEWLGALVRVVVLAWSGAILTLAYVAIPGIPQQKIDPTFIASIFTGALATFGVQRANSSDKKGTSSPSSGQSVTEKKKEE
jgi:hypothetical protein